MRRVVQIARVLSDEPTSHFVAMSVVVLPSASRKFRAMIFERKSTLKKVVMKPSGASSYFFHWIDP